MGQQGGCGQGERAGKRVRERQTQRGDREKLDSKPCSVQQWIQTNSSLKQGHLLS